MDSLVPSEKNASDDDAGPAPTLTPAQTQFAEIVGREMAKAWLAGFECECDSGRLTKKSIRSDVHGVTSP